ncbi:MAG: hypothetical protein HC932_00185 [Thermales bacterium]|nr:hypothetical protein [Thermales bacterium]
MLLSKSTKTSDEISLKKVVEKLDRQVRQVSDILRPTGVEISQVCSDGETNLNDLISSFFNII